MFNSQKISKIISENSVIILFIVLCAVAFPASRLSLAFVVDQLLTRVGRNLFLVLSLIVPIVAGMGLNFGIVIGAIAAQLAMIWVTHMQISGFTGIAAAILVAVPIAVLFGFITGKVMNKMKGQEMIGSMFMGYFANGIYQFILLIVVGGIIPVKNTTLLISGGVGVKNTVDLTGGLKYGIDNIFKLSAFFFFTAILIIIAITIILDYFAGKREGLPVNKTKLATSLCFCGVAFLLMLIPKLYAMLYYIEIPVATFGLILLLVVFNKFLLNTKLGQNMRTVGQNRVVANAAGIKVEKTRVIAIIISTVCACIGQIISLQNIGNIQTYSSQEQVGLFAVASLLVGGASVSRATNAQAVIGVVLFHSLAIIAPSAGKNLFASAQIGEYFRIAVTYSVIAVAIIMYTYKENKKRG